MSTSRMELKRFTNHRGLVIERSFYNRDKDMHAGYVLHLIEIEYGTKRDVYQLLEMWYPYSSPNVLALITKHYIANRRTHPIILISGFSDFYTYSFMDYNRFCII